MNEPALSVVVVSDYASGGAADWADIRSTLGALARQQHGVEIEVIVCEDERLVGGLPADVLDAYPGSRVLCVPATGSYALKNAGARAASAPLVAILDADCRPRPGWAEAISACQWCSTSAATSGSARSRRDSPTVPFRMHG